MPSRGTPSLPPQATCVLQPPDEGTEVVPVPPEDLLHVERLVGIAVPIPPPWGFGGFRGDPPPLPPNVCPPGLYQHLVPGAELPRGEAGAWWGSLHPAPAHPPRQLLQQSE